MQPIYCANCGTRLNIARKALPQFGTIINIAEFHECLDEPIELDLTPIDLPEFKMTEGKDKFIKNVDDLIRPSTTTEDLRDRRETSDVKSTAPDNILEHMKNQID